jgi:hypothetical protein
MKREPITETEATEFTNNNSAPIELTIVQGETSGLFKIDARTGSVEFSEDISYEQWREILRLARTIRRKAAITVADCMSFGIKKWGAKRVDEALEQLELEATLVKTAVAISSIPRELRFEHLDGEHYVELARSEIPRAQKIRWARIAHEQRLTPSQLRFSILEGEVVDRGAAKMLQTGVITVHGIRQSFDVWSRRVGGLDGVQAMALDHQVEIMEELDAIVEFGLQLSEHLDKVQLQTGQTDAPHPDAA